MSDISSEFVFIIFINYRMQRLQKKVNEKTSNVIEMSFIKYKQNGFVFNFQLTWNDPYKVLIANVLSAICFFNDHYYVVTVLSFVQNRLNIG